MKVKTLNKGDCITHMKTWIDNTGNMLPEISSEYQSIRYDIQKLYEEVNQSWNKNIGRKDYYIDISFGLKLRSYLEKQSWFTMRVACDVGFWRYLSIMVVPNIVAQRWNYDNEDHYWKKPARIWLRSIWWYTHIAYKKDENSTQNMLMMPRFTTDTILNLVERTGKKGTEVKLYNAILWKYSKLNEKIISDFQKHSSKNSDLFRSVMRLNTAKILVVEPYFCKNGVDGYVDELFDELLKITQK